MAHETAVWNGPIRSRVSPAAPRSKAAGGTTQFVRRSRATVTETPEPQGEETSPCFESRVNAFLSTLSDPAFVLRKDGVIVEAYVPPHYEFALAPNAVVGR